MYRISYADIADVQKALRDVLTKNGKIAANPGTSNIIITDTAERLVIIDDIIKEIDREIPQILVEASCKASSSR